MTEKSFAARKKYNVPSLNVRHFCVYQNPPCNRTDCRVASHIIVGLFPQHFSQFLIYAYLPLTESERKEVMGIKNYYLSYLMQKFHDEKSTYDDSAFDISVMTSLNEMEHTLLCAIGTAFAECYLIDALIPVKEILESCFILENNDIQLNMYWLECIYMLRESDDSPLKNFEKDTRVMEQHLRTHLDHLGLTKPGFNRMNFHSLAAKCDEVDDDKLHKFIASLVKYGEERASSSSAKQAPGKSILKKDARASDGLAAKSSSHSSAANAKSSTKECCDLLKSKSSKEEMVDAVARLGMTLNQ